jgi:hypothetical protein
MLCALCQIIILWLLGVAREHSLQLGILNIGLSGGAHYSTVRVGLFKFRAL